MVKTRYKRIYRYLSVFASIGLTKLYIRCFNTSTSIMTRYCRMNGDTRVKYNNATKYIYMMQQDISHYVNIQNRVKLTVNDAYNNFNIRATL